MKTKIGFVNLLMASVLACTAILGGVMPQQIVKAETAEIFFSEYIEGSSYNKALEIFNGTGGNVDLTGYSVELYSNGSPTASQSVSLSGTLPNNDVYIIANGGATQTILDVTDLISNAVANFNGDDALVLKKGTLIIDVIGQIGFDPGTEWGTGLVSTADNTLRRKNTVCAGDPDGSDVFDPSNEWDGYATDTLDGLGSHTATCDLGPLEPKINEFVANHVGIDTNEYVEIYGEPDTDYSTYTILEIEGDDTGQGVIDEVIQVGTTNSEGFWVTNFLNNAFENGTLTLLLVTNFTGALGNDLDTDNDGTFDVTPWDEIIDAVAVTDGGSLDKTYGLPVLSPIFDSQSFTVGGASRIPDGFDTDAASDWVRNDFDLAGIDGFTGSIGLGEAYNTPGSTNLIFIPPPEACGDAYTPIYTIQGSGLASELDGTEVATEGVVVGDFQVGGKNGFNIQDPTGDDDPATSDGIFVYYTGLDVNVGDHVRVRGFVDEYFGLTEITSVSQAWLCDTGLSTTPTEIALPVSSLDDFEPFEGMLVTFPQDLIISEYFNFDRYGEIVLTSTRHLTPTALYEPGSPEQAAAAETYLLDRITLDDGRTTQNPNPAIHPNGLEFTMDNLFRGGDLVTNVTGVLDYNFNLWKIQPTQGADYTSMNPRTSEPEDVGGSLKVASFNVLNYFSTIDTGVWICGPSEDMECRGADSTEEFTRQRDKIFAALTIIDADIVGLMEIENHITDAAVMDFVDGLNAIMGAGTYAYIDTGFIGTDAIKVAIIYKTATVTPLGDYAILDSTVDPRFDDSKNRPTLAQTFQEIASGETVTVAVNHLKSKGSACDDVGDPDLDDGAGNCNLTRKAAAEAMVDWLATDPTDTGSMNTLIIGDLNSYDKEDPVDAILAGSDDTLSTEDDYTDLLYHFIGEDAYTYVFDGQIGYLDHGLANSSLLPMVTGTTVWHTNADEPDLIDYDMNFKLDPQDALYAPDAFRSSDHDPVIIGLFFNKIYMPLIFK